ncbi:MAG: ABC transporter ATP-binding protein/permease [Hyphomicrobiaceae bacterium]
MTEAVETPAPPSHPALDPKIAWAFCRYAGGYWRGQTARQAWLLTIGLGICLALSTAVTVALNHWNRWFFDALEKKDVAALWPLLLWVVGIIAIMAAVGVGIVLTRETLQVRWRAWLIDRLLGQWLGERRFYHMNANRTEPANPEYRIADDTRWATEPLTDLGIGLVIAVLNATAFIYILWSVGGSLKVPIGGATVTIPAYMVLLALLYGVIMSSLMLWIGKPLPGLVYMKNEREGDFRFALMRLRENAESVALMAGHTAERSILGRAYERAVTAWLQIVKRHGHVTWVTNSSGPLIQIFPLLMATPKYLAGELSLGEVTQLAGAFVAVQGAISWLVDNFNRISEWYASARRVMDIVDACDVVDQSRLASPARISIGEHAANTVSVSDLGVDDPFGTSLLKAVGLEARAGESVHVAGDTSVGKTTLVRALGGLWQGGSGGIRFPATAKVMIVPQKPYMPLGSIRDAFAYPDPVLDTSDAALHAALHDVGLPHLAQKFDEIARWDQRLSNGERQRFGVARVLLHKPDVLILDDALSALDEASQVALFKRLRLAIPNATIVNLGQAQPPAGLHDRVVVIERRGGVATIRTHEKSQA